MNLIESYINVKVMNEVRDEQRGSVSNENNILLDPDVVTDPMSQVKLIFSIAMILVNLGMLEYSYRVER